jgi:hypothetical protein
MNHTTKFTLTTIWILLTRFYDMYCTYCFTPDLSKESNPLSSVLGLGWRPLIIIIGLLSAYTIYAYYLCIYKPMHLLPTEKGYSFSNFVAFIYLGQKENWTAVLYKLPKDLNRFNQCMGHILSKCLVVVGFISTSMWLLINHTDYYKKLHNAKIVYGIILISCISVIYSWNKNMYKKYLIN